MMIAVFGSINIDITAYADRLPAPGETLHGIRYLTGLGGKGANQAAAAARLGGQVSFMGRTGLDHFGDTGRQLLAEFGVDTTYLRADAGHATGIAIINVDGRGENFITVIAGANFAVDASDVAMAADALRRSRILLLQLEVPLDAIVLAAGHARKAGARVILDPAPVPSSPERLDLGFIDIVTPNETETERLTGIHPASAQDLAAAAHALHRKGPAVVIIKLGDKGVYLSTPSGATHIPAFRVKTVDTVAAGDCFNGGLAYALSRNLPIHEATRFAAACGALSTTRFGAAAAAPTLPEVEALLAG
jgi:ribokinase